MSYPSYLVHYNKNHNPKNGQFAPGDGDGDGVVNDRKSKITPDSVQGKIAMYNGKDKLKKNYDSYTTNIAISGAAAGLGALGIAAGIYLGNPLIMKFGAGAIGASVITVGQNLVERHKTKNLMDFVDSIDDTKKD